MQSYPQDERDEIKPGHPQLWVDVLGGLDGTSDETKYLRRNKVLRDYESQGRGHP
jgi:hypothetical protein